MRCLLAVAVLAAGCGSPTGPEVERFDFFRDQALEPAVLVQGDLVVVEGSFRAPCIPYEIHGELAARQRELTLLVIGQDEDDDCPVDAIEELGYRAVIRPWGAGEWAVKVVHRWSDAGWPEEVVAVEVVDL